MSDHVELGRVANTYESKQADRIWHSTGYGKSWSGFRATPFGERRCWSIAFAPETGFGFGKGGRSQPNTPGGFRLRPAHRRGLKVSTLLVVCSRSRATRRLRRAGLRDNNESLELALAFQFGATCEKITVA